MSRYHIGTYMAQYKDDSERHVMHGENKAQWSSVTCPNSRIAPNGAAQVANLFCHGQLLSLSPTLYTPIFSFPHENKITHFKVEQNFIITSIYHVR